ncbi:MAG: hypothetical protein OQL06_04805 [Gammaproteobacteria bacterium]|nr:hypothetical protein [Gammaproteobacteria bacterium]
MFPLKQALAEYGFESRENYDYAIQRFLEHPNENIRCLNVDGEPGRRKTAFANALAQALKVSHVLYYEFGADKPVPQTVRVVEGEELPEEPPTQPFDRIMTEACALSEAESIILILDQLHLAEFQQHLRLFEFVKTKIWAYSDVQFHANQANLIVFLLSNEPLYHSLQVNSFRLWVSAVPEDTGKPLPEELGLDDSCQEWLDPLNELISKLGLTPSIKEYQKLAHDIEQSVRTEEQLKISIFGWLENVDRNLLNSRVLSPLLVRVLRAIEDNLSIQEEIELSSEGID